MAGEPGHSCARGPRCQADYQARISGPLLDRIDLRVEVPAVSAVDLIARSPAEPSERAKARVGQARAIQAARYLELGHPAVRTNAQCPGSMVEAVAALDEGAGRLLREAAEQTKFSARAYHRILKVARTLADLEGSDSVRRVHLAEAVSYRMAGERLTAPA